MWRGAWSLLMNLHATSTYISTYPLAISLSISQCNNLDFQFEYWIESHHHLSNLLVLTYLPTHQSNKDKLLWMIWLNEYQGWTMQWVGSQCSWVRVHPIPLNQFTLFSIIPIYMLSTQNYESENQTFVFF